MKLPGQRPARADRADVNHDASPRPRPSVCCSRPCWRCPHRGYHQPTAETYGRAAQTALGNWVAPRAQAASRHQTGATRSTIRSFPDDRADVYCDGRTYRDRKPAARTTVGGVLTGDTDGKPQNLRHDTTSARLRRQVGNLAPRRRLHVGALLALELRHPSGRGSRHELHPQAGGRLDSGRPALGYLSGVSPQVDADVAEAQDVIHNSSVQGAGLYEILAPSGRSVVLGPCGARSPCYLFLSPPGGAPGALSETRPRVLLLLGAPLGC